MLIHAAQLSRRFGSDARSFTLHLDRLCLSAGDCLAVTGPSGCGKSSLLGLLSLALRPAEAGEGASLRIDGVDALGLWRRGRSDDLALTRATTIGFVPQTGALLNFLSLRRNIELPQRISFRRDAAYVDEIAGWLGIGDILHRMPGQVSVGQRQRAAIARALAHRPRIVLADEPTASVHPSQADAILKTLLALTRRAGTALIVTTHDAPRAAEAGFAIAPCQPAADGLSTSFAWAGQI